MFEPEKGSQYAKEADRIAELDRARADHDVGRDEVIESQDARSYRPPLFVADTAGDAEFRRLGELFHEVCETNEMLVGLKCREAEAYLCLTGQKLQFQAGLKEWLSRYLELRIARDNPKDGGDSFKKYCRLIQELDRVLLPLQQRRNTVNYAMLEQPLMYGRWLLYQRTWREDVRIDGNRFVPLRAFDSNALLTMKLHLEAHGWEGSSLPDFVAACATRISNPDQSATTLDEADRQEASVRRYMRLIDEMRPFLLDTRPERLRVSLPQGGWVSWRWTIGPALGTLVFCREERESLLPNAALGKQPLVGVSFDGHLFSNSLPWITGFAPALDPPTIHVNAWLLDAFFRQFLELYERIDFEAVRAVRRAKTSAAEITDAELAVSNADLDQSEAPDTAPAPDERRDQYKLRLRSIRRSVLLRLLDRKFGCEIRHGKGSEVVVYRQGARSFVLGTHGGRSTVSTVKVGMALRALGISRHDWCNLEIE